MKLNNIDELVNHLKTQGFVFQGSEIYGGLSNTWDYGPLGVRIKRKLKHLWWNFFINNNKFNEGLDSAILMNPKVWVASGHVNNFSDPLMDCKACKTRHRADKLIEEKFADINCGGWSNNQLADFIKVNKIACPKCNKLDFTEIRQFELMFKTHQGVVQNDQSVVYLRPETAQGIFVNFKNIQRSLRKKLPFGVGQIGKSFRNEITPGNFIFRTREFEQMEIEFFFDPTDQTDWFNYWLEQIKLFLSKIGIDADNYRIRNHDQEELSHYSSKTVDIEYHFPFATAELWGLAHRGDYDLAQHQTHSSQDLSYFDDITNQRIIGHVIEPSVGVERLLLAVLCQAYCKEVFNDKDERTVLKLSPLLAPYLVAVLPLSKQLNEPANQLYEQLLTDFDVTYDQTGNIGKRYRRQDAIGTYFCLTYDFESENDQMVTVRNRDTMEQKRIKISEISTYLNQFK